MQVRLRGRGGSQVATGAEAHDADPLRINPILRRIGTEQTDRPAGVRLGSRKAMRRDPVGQDGPHHSVGGEERGKWVTFVRSETAIAAPGTDQNGSPGSVAAAVRLENCEAGLRLIHRRIVRTTGRPEWQSNDFHDALRLTDDTLIGQERCISDGWIRNAARQSVVPDSAPSAMPPRPRIGATRRTVVTNVLLTRSGKLYNNRRLAGRITANRELVANQQRGKWLKCDRDNRGLAACKTEPD